MSVSRSQPVTTMTTDQCWAAVSRMALGRLVTVIDDEPDIFPVNYVVQQRTILFRTAPGVKLLGVQRNPRVAFEVDDHTVGTGWSVIVRGEAGVVTGTRRWGGPNVPRFSRGPPRQRPLRPYPAEQDRRAVVHLRPVGRRVG